MRSKSLLNVRTIALLVAFGIGIAIGSWTELFGNSAREGSISINENESEVSVDTEYPGGGAVNDVAGINPSAGGGLPMTATDKVEDPVVLGPDGVKLRAARDDGGFRGYLVLDPGSDSRLKINEIIVEIGGVPVEDSAAGSELLLIALAERGSEIGLSRGENE